MTTDGAADRDRPFGATESAVELTAAGSTTPGVGGLGGGSGPGRRRAPRPPSARWYATGLVALLAAILGLTLVLRSGAAPACATALAAPLAAAPPAGGALHKGKATFYDSKGAGGNCSLPGAPTNRLYVALGPSEYSAGAACGGYLDVTGPRGSVRVLVMDQCPECAPGHLDLSREAFARIADPVQGIVPVSYRVVADPPLPGPLTFRLKEGSSQWWFAVQVGNHGNTLRAVEANGGNGWRAATRTDYNYWIVESGVGAGPYRIRVTDTRGHRVIAEGVRMAPGQLQRSTVTMYGRGSARSTASPSAPTGKPSPRPSVVPSATAGPSATGGPAGATTGAGSLGAPVGGPTPGCGG